MTDTQKFSSIVVQGTIADWCDGFILDRRAMGLSEGTIEFYVKKLKGFIEWCRALGITDINEIDPETLRRFVVHLQEDHNPGGVIAYIKSLRAFFTWYENETEEPSPMKRIKTPRYKIDPLEPADIDDVRKMLSKANRRDKAIVLVLLDTGARASELISLDVMDVNLIHGSVSIVHGKGGFSRTVYVGRKSRQALRAYAHHREGPLFRTDEGERLTYSGLRMIIQRLAIKAKVPIPPLHSFRRLCALTKYRETGDLFAVQRYLGHTNPKTTMRYLRLTPEDIYKTISDVSPVDKLI